MQAKGEEGNGVSRPGARPSTEAASPRPLLLIDVDGVISLFGFSRGDRPAGAFHWIDGIPHFLSTAAAENLLGLVSVYDLLWCSGWEEKADEYLPHLLGLPAGLPFLSFEREVGGAKAARAHWKLDAIDAYAGADRALAWIDDAFNEACEEWAAAREGPTLLVRTAPEVGFTERDAQKLARWADSLAQPCP